VGAETTYSMTVGQLSSLRDTQVLPEDRRWENNLSFVWGLRRECTAEEVWTALGALAMRHESLRTHYRDDGSPGGPHQVLAVEDVETVLALTEHGTADIADLSDVEERAYKQPFDIYGGMPWRACVITDGGAPRKVVFVVNHIAADGAAVLILEADFHALLAGEELPPPGGQPRTIAQNEQSPVSARRLRTAERYWRQTLAAAPRRPPGVRPASGEMIGATLRTGVPLELAHEGAAKLDASIASVLLAACYQSLREITGRSQILLLPMSANRFDSATAAVVTSLNQRVPLLLDFDGSESFPELAAKVHWESFKALKHGYYDPDAIARIRQEFFEQADPPVDPGYNFNGILAPPRFAPPVQPEPAELEFSAPARTTIPGFYLAAMGIERIDLLARTNRAEFDQPAFAAFLSSVQEILLDVAGLLQADQD